MEERNVILSYISFNMIIRLCHLTVRRPLKQSNTMTSVLSEDLNKWNLPILISYLSYH